MRDKSALISGVSGQDGAYLAEYLLKLGYEVIGIVRRQSSPHFWRLSQIVQNPKFTMVEGDVTDFSAINRIVNHIRPDEIYNLAAQSFVGGSFESPHYTSMTCAIGPLNFLDAICANKLEKTTRFYQASTSELFGKVLETPQSETTPFYPRSPYAVAKQYGHWITKNYRESKGLFACSGILFNHESPNRGDEFVTQKICKGVAQFCRDGTVLRLGNIDAQRDWGHAKDFIRAMHLMLQQDSPVDYVIATGELNSVRHFVSKAFSQVGIGIKFEGSGLKEVGRIDSVDYEKLKKFAPITADFFPLGTAVLEIDEKFFRPAEVELLLGDSSKARADLGWEPSFSFEDMISEMVAAAFTNVYAR